MNRAMRRVLRDMYNNNVPVPELMRIAGISGNQIARDLGCSQTLVVKVANGELRGERGGEKVLAVQAAIRERLGIGEVFRG